MDCLAKSLGLNIEEIAQKLALVGDRPPTQCHPIITPGKTEIKKPEIKLPISKNLLTPVADLDIKQIPDLTVRRNPSRSSKIDCMDTGFL